MYLLDCHLIIIKSMKPSARMATVKKRVIIIGKDLEELELREFIDYWWKYLRVCPPYKRI